ncbi:GNAT family N-acetyltransferase [Bradyrhizobium altum]|uniref:GNAT family N-acetyltransferase n=1 Tax=Bradyrhizobium altum TaxID=1571202 RepID=UPI001E2F16E6|nr:GNAT family N-acetyltransferase [Bradyrhizobium altum]
MAEAARIRDYRSSDAYEVNRLAVTAFEQFRDAFDDWPAMRAGLSKTSELSSGGEIIVAELGDRLAGAVGYFGPGVKKAAFFDQAWPVIRMLVVDRVDTVDRGKGLGHALTSECLARARRDRCRTIALHTSPIMTVA